jgi:hypothetical protein
MSSVISSSVDSNEIWQLLTPMSQRNMSSRRSLHRQLIHQHFCLRSKHDLISSTNEYEDAGYIYSETTPSSNDYISTTTSDTGVLQTIVTRTKRFRRVFYSNPKCSSSNCSSSTYDASGNLISTKTSLDPNTLNNILLLCTQIQIHR